MPVAITILSGSRQGDRIELTADTFEAGDRPTDAVYVNPAEDPGIKGQRAALRLEGDGWRIRSMGVVPVILNHEPVVAPRPLRSGDIIRMSEDGPDFSFDLISRLTLDHADTKSTSAAAQPTAVSSPNAPAPQASSAATITEHATPLDSEPPSPTVQLPFGTVSLSLGVLAGVVAIGVLIFLSSKPKLPSQPPKFAHLPSLPVDEGQPLLWTPELLHSESLRGPLTFSLGRNAPTGLEIDKDTGTIQWTPTEAQGPGKYKCVLQVTSGNPSDATAISGTVYIQVREINQPPVLAPLGSPIVNLSAGRTFTFQVRGSDPDLPAQTLSFALGPDAPSTMQLDPQSGRLTWEVDNSYANRDVAVEIHLKDNAANPLSASATLRVRIVSPDPWEVAAARINDSLYLIAARTPTLNSLVPLGTGCAIREHTLLTSATVATAVESAKQRGWAIVALTAADLGDLQSQGLPITDVKAHIGYVNGDDPETQPYFDLALLTTRDKLPVLCSLATSESELINGQTVGSIGFTIGGGALTRFDRPKAELNKLELYSVIPLEAGIATDDGLLLLQLQGEMPEYQYGSPVVNSAGEVLGVYALQGELPEDVRATHIHYAPVVTVVTAWLAGAGKDHWVTPRPVASETVPQ
jgi:hypothetical protein